ncbi:proton-conducting transporter membrane subunit [Kaistia dalseonensis]|uniref:Formate hydrogenlyase subunit 3/multisubunit Na+/H+ antiporter MnhD subunit n=1 Tax=Kaistia dalseonensis TaxID=410840 RepID=A0ABU0H847_9HYPH|nr:proton-conducting transporter membrane subunit [Kaistia dalseonensis]MCX5495849.1 proton-conducting transporter membrane subunit [Kaistia dalseonensis]MDQ0438450.1 formate hydrogenlyase subunit 3/multisubunit Na+/H+ antiporter MnhD subunit [Kaistia dalseonensis]
MTGETTAALLATTSGGYLLVLAIMLPLIGTIAIVLLGGQRAERVALVVAPLGLVIAAAILASVWSSGQPLVYIVGGWRPPLGLALRSDGISAVMIAITAIVMCATVLFARGQFRGPAPGVEGRAQMVFWSLLLAVWGALNAVFLGDDLFNLYVALELLTFGAVPLVCLDGRAETLSAALRYLLFALMGSVLYLLGVALIYGAYGTLDIVLLAGVVRSEPVIWVAVALMTVGLIAKTALFPLHLWLPNAHAGAPAAASAILSALVVKGSFFLILRLWFDVMPGQIHLPAQILGFLGAGAILLGSVLALRQARLKLLIAYSTIAQIGYLFLLFPLAVGSGIASPFASIAWTAGLLQLASHAFAKAAMFMAAGMIYEALGHDRIDRLGGAGRVVPIAVFAFAIGGLSLMGLPPSGGFSAKWMLLQASVGEGQWWWIIVITLGGLLAAGYIFRVISPTLIQPFPAPELKAVVPVSRQGVALALALFAVLLGFVPLEPWPLLQIGRTAVEAHLP